MKKATNEGEKMDKQMKEVSRTKLREDFERERRWRATIYIRAESKAEAKDFLEDNLSGIWLQVDDFEFEEVPRFNKEKRR